jgi:hypothetical protein
MLDPHLLNQLQDEALISAETAENIKKAERNRLFSLHWELKTMLYLGVLLMNLGLGFLIYQNIDTIGHLALILAIGAVSAACFWYAFRHRKPFSFGEVISSTPYYDYLLLLGCLTFLIMQGYWQYQYQVFGERYGLATFIPMVLFFILAYWLDNRAVLSLAISALATWLGITVTPHELLQKNDFNSESIILTGVGLGIFLSAVPFISEYFRLKKHFSLTYLNFGIHLLMISCLSGMIALEQQIYYFPVLLAGLAFYLWYARVRESFYFLTVSVIYGYIGITWMLLHDVHGWELEWYMLYYIVTSSIVIMLLINHKKFFKLGAG